MTFALSPGQAADDPAGRKLLAAWGPRRPRRPRGVRHVIMDRAYEGDVLRRLVRGMGLSRSCRPSSTGCIRGIMTVKSIKNATKSNVYSGA